MNLQLLAQDAVLVHAQLCHQQLKQAKLWLAAVIVFIFVIFYVYAKSLMPENLPMEFSYIAMAAGMPFLVMLAVRAKQYISSKANLTDYENIQIKLEESRSGSSVTSILKVISETSSRAKANHLIPQLLKQYQPMLRRRMTELYRKSLMSELDKEYELLRLSCKNKIQEICQQVPLMKARTQITTSLSFLTTRREEMTAQWEEAYTKFSWWNKCKFSEGPDFSEIDKAIAELSVLYRKLGVIHSEDFEMLGKHFEQLEQQALTRLSDTKVEAVRCIQNSSYEDNKISGLIQKSLWFSAMSVPLSIWNDLDSAANVYESLRAVNGNFSSMSDGEIWLESLFLPAESLAGLAALTKGAYFERLVANDTGGELFAHFNHPDTDIVIDGISFQLKATDSPEYVFSVDESIPVIATTEVALATGVIDSGYSNEELTRTIDSALGGTIIDIGDTGADAILAGLGGLGFFATIEGINHASKKHENGGDAVEALFEGAGVAIEGTARGLFGLAEMAYNIWMSRPIRFIGRVLLSLLKKFDDKVMNAADQKGKDKFSR